jgi:hypothetical protein
MSTPMQIGFSQRVQLDWLEQTAALVFAGQTRAQITTALQELLHDKLSVGGTAPRGNREKAITILLHIWVSVPRRLQPFRDDGLDSLQRLPLNDHLALHWGMTMTVYPFFGAVAETVGRLMRLQGTCAAAQIQRRIREQLGERETVARAARRILRCLVDWGVLQETQQKGVYRTFPVRAVQDKRLTVWLVEAALRASCTDKQALKMIAQTPALFPFSLAPLYPSDLADHARLELFRHSLDEDMVTLRSSGVVKTMPVLRPVPRT